MSIRAVAVGVSVRSSNRRTMLVPIPSYGLQRIIQVKIFLRKQRQWKSRLKKNNVANNVVCSRDFMRFNFGFCGK